MLSESDDGVYFVNSANMCGLIDLGLATAPLCICLHLFQLPIRPAQLIHRRLKRGLMFCFQLLIGILDQLLECLGEIAPSKTSPLSLIEVAHITRICRLQGWLVGDDAGSGQIGVLTFFNEPTLHDDFRTTWNLSTVKSIRPAPSPAHCRDVPYK